MDLGIDTVDSFKLVIAKELICKAIFTLQFKHSNGEKIETFEREFEIRVPERKGTTTLAVSLLRQFEDSVIIIVPTMNLVSHVRDFYFGIYNEMPPNDSVYGGIDVEFKMRGKGIGDKIVILDPVYKFRPEQIDEIKDFNPLALIYLGKNEPIRL